MKMKKITGLVSIMVMVVFAQITAASIIDVVDPNGDTNAGVYIEWNDGFNVEFNVYYDAVVGESTYAMDLLSVLDVELGSTFELDLGYYEGMGYFVNNITYDGHTGVYTGGDEDWWHFWDKPADGEWYSPPMGASGIVVEQGDLTGWIYGRGDVVPEPASIGLLVFGSLLLRKRRA